MVKTVLFSVAIPAALGAVVLAIAQGLWRGSGDAASPSPDETAGAGALSAARIPSAGERPSRIRPGGAWGCAVAMLVVFLAAMASEEGLPQWPPASWYALAVPLLGAALAAAAARSSDPPSAWHAACAAAVVAAATGAAARFPEVDGWNWRVALMVAAFISILCWGAARGGREWLTVCAPAMLIFAALSILLLESRFAKASLICGALSAFNGLAAALGLLGRPVQAGWGGAMAIGALAPAAALCGYAYDYDVVPAGCWILVAAAPLAIGALSPLARPRPGVCGPPARHPPITRLLAPLVAVLLICGVSVAWALRAGSSSAADDYAAGRGTTGPGWTLMDIMDTDGHGWTGGSFSRGARLQPDHRTFPAGG
ncbi:MAG: hypothetical protein C4547_11720 [Phycisphaerales bacterium]|nr:MAG: hypothetical protein C4547_11720 [Phycisphaerales bacterium]